MARMDQLRRDILDALVRADANGDDLHGAYSAALSRLKVDRSDRKQLEQWLVDERLVIADTAPSGRSGEFGDFRIRRLTSNGRRGRADGQVEANGQLSGSSAFLLRRLFEIDDRFAGSERAFVPAPDLRGMTLIYAGTNENLPNVDTRALAELDNRQLVMRGESDERYLTDQGIATARTLKPIRLMRAKLLSTPATRSRRNDVLAGQNSFGTHLLQILRAQHADLQWIEGSEQVDLMIGLTDELIDGETEAPISLPDFSAAVELQPGQSEITAASLYSPEPDRGDTARFAVDRGNHTAARLIAGWMLAGPTTETHESSASRRRSQLNQEQASEAARALEGMTGALQRHANDPSTPDDDAELIQAKLQQIQAWHRDPQADPQVLELHIRSLVRHFADSMRPGDEVTRRLLDEGLDQEIASAIGNQLNDAFDLIRSGGFGEDNPQVSAETAQQAVAQVEEADAEFKKAADTLDLKAPAQPDERTLSQRTKTTLANVAAAEGLKAAARWFATTDLAQAAVAFLGRLKELSHVLYDIVP